MSASISVIDELINTFDGESSKQKTITITKHVVKVEHFSDDYHDFDMNELMNNKELMQQLLLMEQDEAIPILKSYLPSSKELELIKTNLNNDDIEINEQSSIINYAQKFKIDKFQFAIQFMIFPKSFINIWLGFIGIINQTQNNMINEHFMSNLMIAIPHRKPLNDEFGQTNWSSMPLLSEPRNDTQDNNNNNDNNNTFMLSVNDLSIKLSKMITKISKSTVQISCNIPSKILNETNMLFEIEKSVMDIYNQIQSQNKIK